MSVYTVGVWTVKPGREEEFIEAWRAFAEQTTERFSVGSAALLRDRDEPSRFISAGPWPSLDVIEAWRESEFFRDSIGRLRELVDDVQPRTMDPVATIGNGLMGG